MELPRLAITMGDPAGIGPEVCLRLLDDRSVTRECVPIVLGDAGVLARVAGACGLPMCDEVVPAAARPDCCRHVDGPAVIDLGEIDAASVVPGKVDAATGRASLAYVEAAVAAAVAGEVDGMVTGPIHKEAWRAAGVEFPGHTELLVERTGAARHCMLLTSDELSCSLVTTHVGLAEVAGLLSPGRIREVIELTAEALALLVGRPPRLVVCGLNPHAGEHGLFGRGEEETIIAPAVADARAAGLDVEGPLSPDTAFLPERRRATDGYVCMYHDQGLIPLKTLAFDEAVNVTLGLPIVRTSVDHGTALDIAWTGRASAGSLRQAVALAARMARARAGAL